MQESIIIPARFRGPPESGNGGYVAGAIAECFAEKQSPETDDAIEVTLRAPTPLDRSMTVIRPNDDSVQLILGETLIAEARRTQLELDVPEPPSFAAALAAQPQSPSFFEHINPLLPEGMGFHPICFCCGTDVEPDAGLHVYAAPVEGFDGVAAAWQPSNVFADPDGLLPTRILWAALDCPGQFAYLASGIRTGMLGRMTGRILKPVPAAQALTVIGWCLDVERSKHFAGTALFDESGDLCGYSNQVWIGRRD
ncbi:MAG: hypothetical protein EP301_11915 [Gammaproteobacteria bacterium]|nr:MAG: hypothetical protein EP301_11915 [Gammaproteobacteria bacterium]